MLIIELTYIKPLELINQHLEDHKAFLNKHYDQKHFLASGAKVPREGGVILALGTKNDMEQIIKEDPFYQNNLAEYRIIEFSPTLYAEDFKSLIG